MAFYDKCPKCGSKYFTGRQVTKNDVLVNGKGEFLQQFATTDSDSPYGPFTCRECGTEYENLPIEIPDKTPLQILLEEAKGLNEEDIQEALDEEVHAIASRSASSVNNEGVQSQLAFILENGGFEQAQRFVRSLRGE